jgi:hypothetical protein
MRSIPIAALSVALAGCSSTAQTKKMTVDEAYLLGAADAVKQLYWAKQALEAPRPGEPAGETRYYTWVDKGDAADGRRLAPQTLAVPVFMPPAPPTP